MEVQLVSQLRTQQGPLSASEAFEPPLLLSSLSPALELGLLHPYLAASAL